MTSKVLYKHFIRELSSIYDSSEAIAINNMLFEKIADTSKKQLIQNPDTAISHAIETKLLDALKELMAHKPVQYVIGEAWFYNLRLKVNEHVLIPRPETEELVKLALDFMKEPSPKKILDIGTGSGCIPISIKKNAAWANVTALDISPDALEIAKANALLHNTAINWLCIDFLKEESWKTLDIFDIIISNPPYIPTSEKDDMDKNVLEFEPSIALFVADERPLIFYEKIAAFAESHLETEGKIFLETHKNSVAEVAGLFDAKTYQVSVKKDISGNDRMVIVNRFR